MHPVARVGLILIAVIAGFTAVNGVVSADRSTVDPSNSQAARYGLVGAGSYTTCAVNNGDIYCSGRMSYSFSTASMTQITLNSSAFRPGTVLDLAVGGPMIFEQTACVVATDGTTVVGGVWCWGSNYRGQFGNNTIDQYDGEHNPPTRVFGNLTGATQVAVGDMHVCVLKSDTTVACAGSNSSGQLGDGSTTDSRTPVTVSTGSGALTGVIAISASGSTTCAIAPDGSTTGAIWCWGDNTYGQLGRGFTGSYDTRAAPVFADGGSTGIDVGGATICSTGAYGARCWGQNFTTWSDIDTPRLGINAAFNSSSAIGQAFPVEVIAFTPTAAATSLVSTCALAPDGAVWCWGDNRGTLGDGTTTDSATPVQVLLPTAVDVLTSGYAHFCASNRVGQMWCWGEGGQFQLGNGSFANRSTPTAVSSRTLDWTYNGTAPTTTAVAPGIGITTAVVLDDTVATPTTRTDAGDQATITHTVTNTGNVTLTNLTVTDTLVPTGDIVCTGGSGNVITTLAPGASTTCTAIHTLSQAEVDSGSVSSGATVSAGSHSASDTDTETATITRVAAHDITTSIGTITDTDTPTDGAGDTGDTATVTHTVTNTGNVTLTSLTVTDTLVPTGDIVCTGGSGNVITTLAPGASTTCTAIHTLTAGDVTAGSIASSASLESAAPSGVTAASTATATDTRSFTPNTTTTTTTSTTTAAPTTTTPGTTTPGTSAPDTTTSTTTTTTVATAQAATGTPDLADLATTLGRGTVTRSIPMPGGTLELVGDGFTPGETVTAGLVSRRPKVLGTTTADQSGRATVTATIDLDQSGPATLILHGATSGHGIAQDITIGGALPTTGRRTTGTDLVVLLAASGALLTLLARRRA